ncbi:MAG: hypothetical protein KIT72_05570 [Polyangiaceae bacterium]|nr:hypothetical protein [Polyangiaceae bacterium]MCW5789868.1 hypothetical protein [Polyangiaceae bacterium]
MADPDRRGARVTPELSPGAPMRDYQRYIAELEAYHGWERVSLVETCFLMGEEVGELFKAVRRVRRLYEAVIETDDAAPAPVEQAARVAEVGDELVDVLNYLLAVANRLDIDVEQAFVAKNTKNLARTWKSDESAQG